MLVVLHLTIYISQAAWTDPNDGRRPRNWPRSRKWITTIILSAVAFLQPMGETALAPAEDLISDELNIRHPYQWMLVNGLILVGLGMSSVILAPLSEAYGRKPILIAGTISFVIWNTAAGTSKNLDTMLALRLLSGIGASVGDSVAGGVLSDLWFAEDRGRAYGVFTAAPTFGTAVAPICGAYISEASGWRWIFWLTSLASGATIIVTYLFLPETYEPAIKERIERKSNSSQTSVTQEMGRITRFVNLVLPNLQRPFRMLGTQIIVQLLSIYMALLYGLLWLFLFIYPKLWTEVYHQGTRTASLNYLSFGSGLLIGANVGGQINDRVYTYLKARNKGVGRPEFRVPGMAIGTLVAPAGLCLWGWLGQAHLHWILPNIGSFVFAVGVYVCSSCVSVYTIDTYTQYAASAISTNLVLRSISGGLFPLFAPYLFDSLGFGLSATVLASSFLGLGITVTCLLWFFGERLRARSPYCAAGDDHSQGH